jgi:RND family efflux transporter MFP subunit
VVGTIQSKLFIKIEPQVRAQIQEIRSRPGDMVHQNEIIVVLDDSHYRAKWQQSTQALKMAHSGLARAREGIKAAHAAYDQITAQYMRTKTYYKAEVATEKDLEEARSQFIQAKARLEQARNSLQEAKFRVKKMNKLVEEAKIALGYTKIRAPLHGQIVKRLSDPGDVARPGQAILFLQNEDSLRLEAQVREELIQLVSIGSRFKVGITSLDTTVEGKVDEIEPTADPQSRTFEVKVSIPKKPGMYSGMFGRLFLPAGERVAILVPKSAIQEVGQLELVTVKKGDTWERIFVETGSQRQDQVEVLAGLSGNEQVALFGERDDSDK